MDLLATQIIGYTMRRHRAVADPGKEEVRVIWGMHPSLENFDFKSLSSPYWGHHAPVYSLESNRHGA